MKYFPKLKQYKASNLVYDIEKEIAHSYDWYVIAKRINGYMIVNSYSYSQTTIRHYYKILRLLESLNIDYVSIEAPKGLQSLDLAVSLYEEKIKAIQERINNPRSKQSTNKIRKETIERLQKELDFVRTLLNINEV